MVRHHLPAVDRRRLAIRDLLPDTAQPVTADNINLVVDSFDPVDSLESGLQELLKVKGWNTTSDCKYTFMVFKLKTINATAKMAVAIKFLAG